MNKRTCKTYTISGVDGILLTAGTVDKKQTEVFYVISKTKIRYSGTENPLSEYKEAFSEFNKAINYEISRNKTLTDEWFVTPNISESNLTNKKYTKVEYQIFMKFDKIKLFDDGFDEIKPFIVNIFEKFKDIMLKHGFLT